MQVRILAKEDAFFIAQEKFKEIVSELSREEMMKKEHSEIEEYLKIEGFELLRRMMQAHLDMRTQQEQVVEVIDE